MVNARFDAVNNTISIMYLITYSRLISIVVNYFKPYLNEDKDIKDINIKNKLGVFVNIFLFIQR